MRSFAAILISAVVGTFAVLPCCSVGGAAKAATQAAKSTTTMNIEGMTCGSCATAVRLLLQKTTGVSTANVSYEQKRAVVTYDPAKTTPETIAAALRRTLPYTVTIADKKRTAAHASTADVGAPLAAYRADELQAAFNAAKDRVRIVALLSPTCGACQHGQRAVQSVFAKYAADQRLQGFVVWLPMLKSDNASAAATQARAFTDVRVVQRWDGSRTSGDLLARTLKLNRTAWDVYLVYAPGVTWNGNAAPQPTFWMHQLRSDSGADQKTCLNPAVLIARIGELLSRKA